jgi:glycosyltransferase involved in cell wall biosynthesis
MQGNKNAESWLEDLHAKEYVELLPVLPPEEMARQFQRAVYTLSLSTHDGTPNTLLEAMACGCFPIVGDLDSLRDGLFMVKMVF